MQQEDQKQEQSSDNQQDTAQEKEETSAQQQENNQEQVKEEQAEEAQEEKKEGMEKGKKEEKKKKKDKEKAAEKSDKEKLAELQDRYLRLQAEYDNYRKRTLKEKMELTRSAGEDILKGLLPVMDDFERAIQSIDEAEDAEALKDGVHLIFGKFKEFLKQQGITEMESQDQEFDTDKHEAISKVPAPSEEMKGKVVDVVQTGYYLNDKVLRYAKVVVGE
ncbi:MAG: nucleotide exchange factor GrpE [Bacteroidales bacterium]|nr:nucleotide exchange factor GrpE [Bacteroidales bacterium]